MWNRDHSDSPKLTSGKLLFLGLGCFFLAWIAITAGQAVNGMKSPRWVLAIFNYSTLATTACGIICILISSRFPSAKRRKRVSFDREATQNCSEETEANV